jgi:hypothetical protein
MNDIGQLIDTLARSEVFKNYESAFNDATNMPLTLRKVGSWQLPFRGKRNESQFCAMMAYPKTAYPKYIHPPTSRREILPSPRPNEEKCGLRQIESEY